MSPSLAPTWNLSAISGHGSRTHLNLLVWRPDPPSPPRYVWSFQEKSRANTELLQTPDDNTLSPDPVATLTKLKAVYDSLNEKRMESGLKVKRDFWKWLKDMFDSPGLKARSFDDHSVIHSNSDNVSKTKRTCVEVSGSEGPILPPVNSHGQHIRRHLDVKRGVPARKCDLNFEAGPWSNECDDELRLGYAIICSVHSGMQLWRMKRIFAAKPVQARGPF